MAFIPTPQGISVEFRYTVGGQQTENVIAVRSEDSAPSFVLADVGQACLEWAEASYMPQQSEDVTLREVYVTDITSDSGGTYTATPLAPVVGGITEPVVANNVAFCLSLRTAKRGRSYRGRWYVGGFTRLAVTDSAIPLSFANVLVGLMEDLQTAINAVGCTWCVLSKRNGGNPRTEGVLTPITAITFADLVVDSQRRRLPGRGA